MHPFPHTIDVFGFFTWVIFGPVALTKSHNSSPNSVEQMNDAAIINSIIPEFTLVTRNTDEEDEGEDVSIGQLQSCDSVRFHPEQETVCTCNGRRQGWGNRRLNKTGPQEINEIHCFSSYKIYTPRWYTKSRKELKMFLSSNGYESHRRSPGEVRIRC